MEALPLLVAAGAGLIAAAILPVCARGVRAAAAAIERAHVQTSRERLADLFLFVDPRRLLLASGAAVLVVAGGVLAATDNALLAAGLGGAMLAVPQLAFRVARQRRTGRINRQLPDALALLAAAIRSGQSLAQAIVLLGERQPPPLAQEFQLLARKQRLGVSFDRALEEMRARIGSEEFALFTAAVRVARDLGGNLAESLERLAGTLRRRLAMDDRIRALTAQGRIQGLIVGALPLVLLWVLSILEPQAMRPLFTHPIGWTVLGLIGTLELVGFLLIRKIVRIEV